MESKKTNVKAPNEEPKCGFSGKPKPRPKRSPEKDKARPERGPEKVRPSSDLMQKELYDTKELVTLHLQPYVNAVARLYACSCNEKLHVKLDVECGTGKDGLRKISAALLTSRVDADAKEFRDGKMTERKWHNVFRKERRLVPGETPDVMEFCTAFIEWCTFLFTDRKALVRELNVGKRRKFLCFRL